MVMNTGAFSEDLWPGIMGWFGDEYKDWPTIWDKLVDSHDSVKHTSVIKLNLSR